MCSALISPLAPARGGAGGAEFGTALNIAAEIGTFTGGMIAPRASARIDAGTDTIYPVCILTSLVQSTAFDIFGIIGTVSRFVCAAFICTSLGVFTSTLYTAHSAFTVNGSLHRSGEKEGDDTKKNPHF